MAQSAAKGGYGREDVDTVFGVGAFFDCDRDISVDRPASIMTIGSGLRAQGSGLRAQGSGLRAQGSGLRAQGSGLRAQGSGLRAQGSGLRAQGSGLRAQGSGLGASRARRDRPYPQPSFTSPDNIGSDNTGPGNGGTHTAGPSAHNTGHNQTTVLRPPHRGAALRRAGLPFRLTGRPRASPDRQCRSRADRMPGGKNLPGNRGPMAEIKSE